MNANCFSALSALRIVRAQHSKLIITVLWLDNLQSWQCWTATSVHCALPLRIRRLAQGISRLTHCVLYGKSSTSKWLLHSHFLCLIHCMLQRVDLCLWFIDASRNNIIIMRVELGMLNSPCKYLTSFHLFSPSLRLKFLASWWSVRMVFLSSIW